MLFSSPLDAVRHAAYRATLTGRSWGIYGLGAKFCADATDKIDPSQLLEVCHP